MTSLKVPLYIVIAIAIFVLGIGIGRGCHNSNTGKADTIRTVTKVFDTATHIITRPVYVTQTNIKRDTIYRTFTITQLDSAAAHYYTTSLFTRKYLDSSLSLDVTDTIGRNTLLNQKIAYKWLKPTTINTTTVLPQAKTRNRVFVGATLGIITNSAYYTKSNIEFSPMLTLVTKNDRLYQIGYAIPTHAYVVGIGFKIHL